MKRSFIAVLAAIFGLGSAASAGSSNANEPKDESTWTLAVGATPEGAVIYRLRSELDASFNRASYPERVIIAWRYTSDNGMPPRAERESMERLENLLAPHVHKVSVLVSASTGTGRREWVYYARSQDGFMAKLNEALQGQPQFPIQIDLWHDPKWTFYDDLAQRVQE
jgi:hypothetical protein